MSRPVSIDAQGAGRLPAVRSDAVPKPTIKSTVQKPPPPPGQPAGQPYRHHAPPPPPPAYGVQPSPLPTTSTSTFPGSPPSAARAHAPVSPGSVASAATDFLDQPATSEYLPPQYAAAARTTQSKLEDRNALLDRYHRLRAPLQADHPHDHSSTSSSGRKVVPVTESNPGSPIAGTARNTAEIVWEELKARKANRDLLAEEVKKLRSQLRRGSVSAAVEVQQPALEVSLAQLSLDNVCDKGVNTMVETASVGVVTSEDWPKPSDFRRLQSELAAMEDAKLAALHKIAEAEAEADAARADAAMAQTKAEALLSQMNVTTQVQTATKAVGTAPVYVADAEIMTEETWASMDAAKAAQTRILEEQGTAVVEPLRVEVDELRFTLRNLESSDAMKTSRINELQSLISSQAKTMQTLESQLKAAQTESKSLQQHADQCEDRAAQAELAASDLKQQLLDLSRRYQDMESRLERAAAQSAKIAELEDEVTSTRTQLEAYKSRESERRVQRRSSTVALDALKDKTAAPAAGGGQTLRARFENARIASTIMASPLFSALSEDEVHILINHCTIMQFDDNNALITQGDRGQFMFIIVDGEVAISMNSKGVDRELFRRRPGEVVGEFSLFSDAPRTASVLAKGSVRALLLTKAQFHALYDSHPGSNIQTVFEKIVDVPRPGQ